jgi:hypothetical protein
MQLRSISALDDNVEDAEYHQAIRDDPLEIVDLEADDLFAQFFPLCTRLDEEGSLTTTYAEVARRLLCLVYNPHTSKHVHPWGTHAFDVDYMEANLELIVEAGVEPGPCEHFSGFVEKVAKLRGGIRASLAAGADSFFMVERTPVGALTNEWLEIMPLHAPASSEGFCDALGDMESYLSPHLSFSRAAGSDPDWLCKHMFKEFSRVDKTIGSLPPSKIGQRVMSVFQKTIWPASLFQEVTDDSKYDDLTDRLVLFANTGIQGAEFSAMLSKRAYTLLRSHVFVDLSAFLEGFTTNNAWNLMISTARLVPDSSLSKISLQLDSLEAVQRLNSLLGTFQEAISHSTVQAMDPVQRIAWLDTELARRTLSKVFKSTPSAPAAGSSLTELDEADDGLHMQFNTASSLSLESKILALCRDKPPDYAFKVYDLIADSEEDLFKKCALGYVKNTGVRPVFKAIVSLQPYWEKWANLRLVWDSSSSETLTSNMRRFTAATGFWDNMKAMRWQKIDILRDVFAPFYRQILLVKLPFARLTDMEHPLLDSYLQSQDYLFGDRAFGALGYKTVERLTMVPDGYAALSDRTWDFWEKGMPLQGSASKTSKHARYAMAFHDGVIAEAATEFSVWAKSTDPRHPFPTRFVPVISPSRQELASKEAQLDKHLGAMDYESSSDTDHKSASAPRPGKSKRQPSLDPKPAKRTPAASAPSPGVRQTPKPKDGKPAFDGKVPAAKDVVLGSSLGRAAVVETPVSISINGCVHSKAELAKACGVGTDDRCWATAVSRMPWPLKLKMCNHAEEPGHESHDSSKHKFTSKQLDALELLTQK